MNKFCLIVVYIFFCTGSFAQVTTENGKKGTIQVKKSIRTNTVEKKAAVKKKRIRYYYFTMTGHNYKITFPESYACDLYPFVFDNLRIAIADADKNLTGNRIVSFDYDLYNSNIFIGKKNSSFYHIKLFQDLSELPPGSSAWISNFIFKDEQGVIHDKEISTFKIEKLD